MSETTSAYLVIGAAVLVTLSSFVTIAGTIYVNRKLEEVRRIERERNGRQ